MRQNKPSAKAIPTRRHSATQVVEGAYRQGLRRRATDRHELYAYYIMLGLMLLIFITLGVLSWQVG